MLVSPVLLHMFHCLIELKTQKFKDKIKNSKTGDSRALNQEQYFSDHEGFYNCIGLMPMKGPTDGLTQIKIYLNLHFSRFQ